MRFKSKIKKSFNDMNIYKNFFIHFNSTLKLDLNYENNYSKVFAWNLFKQRINNNFDSKHLTFIHQKKFFHKSLFQQQYKTDVSHKSSSYVVEFEEKVVEKKYQEISLREALHKVAMHFKNTQNVNKPVLLDYFNKIISPKSGFEVAINVEELNEILLNDFQLINQYPPLWESIFNWVNKYYTLSYAIRMNKVKILKEARIEDLYTLKAFMKCMIAQDYEFTEQMLQTRLLYPKTLEKLGFIYDDRETYLGVLSTSLKPIQFTPKIFRECLIDQLAETFRFNLKNNKPILKDRSVQISKILIQALDESNIELTPSDKRFMSVSLMKLAVATTDLSFTNFIMNERIIPLIETGILNDSNFLGNIFSGYFLLLARNEEQRKVRAFADYFLSDDALASINLKGLISLFRSLYFINDYERMYMMYYRFPELKNDKLGPILFEKAMSTLKSYPSRYEKFQKKLRGEYIEEKEFVPNQDENVLLQAIEFASKKEK